MASPISRAIRLVQNLKIVDRRKLWKHVEIEYLRKFIKYYDVDCVFDIGANLGQYAGSLRAAGFNGLILSFEPIPDAINHLKKISSRDPLWHVEGLAIANFDGTTTFNIMADSQFSSLSTPKHDETALFDQKNKIQKSIEVRAEKLSTAYHRLQALHHFKRPFLKMDTQGFDISIVEGSPEVLVHFVGLQSELAVKKIYRDAIDFRESLDRYSRFGFQLSQFIPNNSGHFPTLVETDCVMVNDNFREI